MEPERLEWEEHYRSGPTPWDTRITPPEVVEFWRVHPVPVGGLALDLGCGTATNVGYLAALGLRVVGCELAGNALATGRQRLHEANAPLSRIQLVQTDVTHLPIHRADACYILDIGCFHCLSRDRRDDYAQSVIGNLASGGHYHLFAFDLLPDKPDRGVTETEVADRFAPHLEIVEIRRGNPDHHPCRWYLLRKKARP
jgi:SAM-dependent methyltransferase